MGFLFAKGKRNTIPEVTGLQIQTAVNTVPIAICYGTPRIPMNIIYANGFRSVKQKAGSSGKGLVTNSGKGAVTGFKYYATYIGALCEGPVPSPGIIAMFENQNVYTPFTLPAGKSIIQFLGSQSQSLWSVISNKWPQDARNYTYTAYLGFNDYELDASGTIPQENFLITARFSASFPLYRYTAPDSSTWLFDSDPALCIPDFLTDSVYGVGFPQSFIDMTTLNTSTDGFDPAIGDAAVSTYCQAVGLGWSTILNNQEPASSILDRWLKNLIVAPIWTGTTLKFIPYCDSRFSANPQYDSAKATVAEKYYTPNITPWFDLSDDNYLQPENAEEDPVILNRVDPRDIRNTVRMSFRDRYNYFNDNVAEAIDELEVELYGHRVDKLGPADEFSLMEYARTAAQLQLQRNLSVRNRGTLTLGPQWCILEPMDILTITDVKQGLYQFPVRLTSVEEDEKGAIKIEFEEFRPGSMQATLYKPPQNNPPVISPTNIVAPSVNAPIIFEPTALWLASQGQSNPAILIGLSGGPNGVFDPNWGGADIYLSLDNITYNQFGTINAPANMGVSGALAAYSGSNPDLVDTLDVNLLESDGSLTSVSSAAAASGQSLCAIVEPNGTFELLSYTTALLTGPNQYTLSGLYRGLFGTNACAHPPGSNFATVDSLLFDLPLQSAYIGKTIYVKFPSFNISNQAPQNLSQATAYTYSPAGYGVGTGSNALALALQQLGPYTIDLSSFYTSSNLDLGAIGGQCSPITFTVDLESV